MISNGIANFVIQFVMMQIHAKQRASACKIRSGRTCDSSQKCGH